MFRKGADAAVITESPHTDELTNKPTLTTTSGTPQPAISVYDIHNTYVDPTLQVLSLIVLVCAFVYLVIRSVRRCRNRTEIYLEIHGNSFSHLICLENTHRARGKLSIDGSSNRIKAGLRFRLVPRLHIDWSDIILVCNSDNVFSRRLSSNETISPISAFS